MWHLAFTPCHLFFFFFRFCRPDCSDDRKDAVVIRNVTIDRCTAGTVGGGIAAVGDSNDGHARFITVESTALLSNTALQGAGLYASISASLTGLEVRSNVATSEGGGLMFVPPPCSSLSANISSSLFSGNTGRQGPFNACVWWRLVVGERGLFLGGGALASNICQKSPNSPNLTKPHQTLTKPHQISSQASTVARFTHPRSRSASPTQSCPTTTPPSVGVAWRSRACRRSAWTCRRAAMSVWTEWRLWRRASFATILPQTAPGLPS